MLPTVKNLANCFSFDSSVVIKRFSVTQILREINLGESRSSKTAVFAIFWGSEFCSLGGFQPTKIAKIHEKSNFRASKCVEMADFALL